MKIVLMLTIVVSRMYATKRKRKKLTKEFKEIVAQDFLEV